MKLISVNRVSKLSSSHNAFTDLCEYNNAFYLCYRQASNHVSKDGRIVIMKSTNLISWSQLSYVSTALSDLRDPKLSVDHNNRLVLLYYQKLFDGAGRNIRNIPHVCFSSDGCSWSSPRAIADNGWWLWRLSWNVSAKLTHKTNKFALGFAYNRKQSKVKLYRGDPFRTFECIDDNAFGLDKNGKGYPNESDVIFCNQAVAESTGLAEGTAICLLRRDSDTGSAQLGLSSSPYRKWQWIDLGVYLGGPSLIQLTDGRVFSAARIFTRLKGPVTYLFELNLNKSDLSLSKANLTPVLELPSGGDNSYPSMVEYQGRLYVSYYSQHETNNCQIYVAEVSLKRER